MTSPFLGSTSGRSRQQLRGQRFTRLSRNVYMLPDCTVDLRTRVEAARLIFPDGVACLGTAAQLQRLPGDDGGRVHLARGLGRGLTSREGIQTHRLVIAEDELLDLDGLLVTNAARTFVDLAAHLDLMTLVALGDVVLRRCSAAELHASVERAGHRPGVVLLRQALPLLDAGAASPAESRARLRLHAAGFTAMRHGIVVRDEAGGWIAEPDLADEQARVALQHEGAVHFAKGEKQRRKDIGRDELTRMSGWEVVVSTALDDARPERLIEKTTAAYLRSARLRGRQVLPVHLR